MYNWNYSRLNYMELKKIKHQKLRNIISSPIIWVMIIPIILCDICIEIYHRICFPLYGIAYVKRSHYIRFGPSEASLFKMV